MLVDVTTVQQVFSKDLYGSLMQLNQHFILANYLRAINDQTYRLPVALSYLGPSYEFVSAIDKLPVSELLKVMREV